MPTRRSTAKKYVKSSCAKKRKTSKKTKGSPAKKAVSKPIKVDYTRFRFINIDSGLDPRYVELLDKNTNEKELIERLNKVFNDDKYSELMAKGIFEATLLKCIENTPASTIALSIYDDISAKMIENLNHKSKVGNYTLMMKIRGKTFDAYEVPFMTPDEIFKENWELQERKKLYVQTKQNEIEMTDAFTCHKCGEKKCGRLA